MAVGDYEIYIANRLEEPFVCDRCWGGSGECSFYGPGILKCTKFYSSASWIKKGDEEKVTKISEDKKGWAELEIIWLMKGLMSDIQGKIERGEFEKDHHPFADKMRDYEYILDKYYADEWIKHLSTVFMRCLTDMCEYEIAVEKKGVE